jgi:hypothetical protein
MTAPIMMKNSMNDQHRSAWSLPAPALKRRREIAMA